MPIVTRLVTQVIGDCQDAPRYIARRETMRDGEDTIVKVPVVFAPGRNPCAFYIVIPQGFVGLVNDHGRYVGLWYEGFHPCAPWVAISHLIPTQHIIYDTPVKQCPTQDNVMVVIDVTFVLKIETDRDDEKSCWNFAYKLGPRGLDEMLKAFQDEAIRGMARKRKYNQIYDLMDTGYDKLLEAQRRELNDSFAQFGVRITSVSVTGVHLPDQFQQTMEEATIWENRNEYKTLEQSFTLKGIECKEAQAKEKQKLKEEMEKWTADKNWKVADMKKEKEFVKAETERQVAFVKEQEKADVLEIRSRTELAVAEMNMKRDVQLAQITSEGKGQAEILKVKTDVYVSKLKADAKAQVAKNRAVCLEHEMKAESFAAETMLEKRGYEEKMRSLQTLGSLASNNSLAISGKCGDNIVAQLLANQRNGAALGLNIDPNM